MSINDNYLKHGQKPPVKEHGQEASGCTTRILKMHLQSEIILLKMFHFPYKRSLSFFCRGGGVKLGYLAYIIVKEDYMRLGNSKARLRNLWEFSHCHTNLCKTDRQTDQNVNTCHKQGFQE